MTFRVLITGMTSQEFVKNMMEEVRNVNDTNHIFSFHHGNTTDMPFNHQIGNEYNMSLRTDRHHVYGHYIAHPDRFNSIQQFIVSGLDL